MTTSTPRRSILSFHFWSDGIQACTTPPQGHCVSMRAHHNTARDISAFLQPQPAHVAGRRGQHALRKRPSCTAHSPAHTISFSNTT